jgi:hypothetical protein
MTLVCQLSKFERENVEPQRRMLLLDRNNEDKPCGDYAPSEEVAVYDLCILEGRASRSRSSRTGIKLCL